MFNSVIFDNKDAEKQVICLCCGVSSSLNSMKSIYDLYPIQKTTENANSTLLICNMFDIFSGITIDNVIFFNYYVPIIKTI